MIDEINGADTGREKQVNTMAADVLTLNVAWSSTMLHMPRSLQESAWEILFFPLQPTHPSLSADCHVTCLFFLSRFHSCYHQSTSRYDILYCSFTKHKLGDFSYWDHRANVLNELSMLSCFDIRLKFLEIDPWYRKINLKRPLWAVHPQ